MRDSKIAKKTGLSNVGLTQFLILNKMAFALNDLADLVKSLLIKF